MTTPAQQHEPFTALILAGRRGPTDPVAESKGLSHKCLAPIGGKTMLERVVEALTASPSVGDIAICIDTADVLPSSIRASVGFVESAATPSLSVLSAIAKLEEPYPLLVTTADHALLRPEIVEYFCRQAAQLGTAVSVAVTPKSVLARLDSQTRRTMFHFRDGPVTGSNLFALMEPASTAAVEFWRQVEQNRKRPHRIIRAFGVVPILKYLTRRLQLDQATETASQAFGVRVSAVRMPYPDAAIDVDSLADLAFVEARLAGRS